MRRHLRGHQCPGLIEASMDQGVTVLATCHLRGHQCPGLIEASKPAALAASSAVISGAISAPASLKHFLLRHFSPLSRRLRGHQCPGLIEA